MCPNEGGKDHMRRKSKAEKQALGTYRPDKEPKRLQLAASDIKAPAFLRQNKVALDEWKRVVPHLQEAGVLAAADVSLLTSYCVLYSRWRAASQDVETNGLILTVTSTTRTGKTQKPVPNPACALEVSYQAQMMRTAVKFGINPLDRPRVEMTSPFDDDDFEAQEDYY